MPLETVCVRCGRIVDAGQPVQIGSTVAILCEGCAGWGRVHASDQEDHEDTGGLGRMRAPSHPDDRNPRI
jgi:hypothetical protein